MLAIKYFSPKDTHLLVDNLKQKGFSAANITDVILTHLHFDHAGGAVSLNENTILNPTFPKATYWSNEIQWESAVHPNKKEAPSFIKDDFIPLQTSRQLKFIPYTQTISLIYLFQKLIFLDLLWFVSMSL